MAKKEITYTEAMNEIEQILDRFRREEMTVDSLDKFPWDLLHIFHL